MELQAACRAAAPQESELDGPPLAAPAPGVVDCDDGLANLALTCVQGSRERSALSEWWPRMRQGDARLALVRHLPHDTLAVFRDRHPSERRRPLEGRALEVLERVLSGRSLNATAIELGVSNSTVSGEFKSAVSALGIGGRLASLPMVVAQLWQANRSCSSQTVPVGTLFVGGVGWQVLLVPRPDLALNEQLSGAELDVCRLQLVGLSHAEIARHRTTSLRTTANQLSAVFRKLAVSGRLELVTKLAQEHLSLWARGPQAA